MFKDMLIIINKMEKLYLKPEETLLIPWVGLGIPSPTLTTQGCHSLSPPSGDTNQERS